MFDTTNPQSTSFLNSSPLDTSIQSFTTTANSLINPLETQLRSASSSSLSIEQASSGVFTVGASGQVTFDYLFDGGAYEGEVAIFDLTGMDRYFQAGSEFFAREAALRALTNTDLGHIVISDQTEGARFSGNLPYEGDFNSGIYTGSKTFSMRSGEQFGIMLVPNGKVEDILFNRDIGGSLSPLFSISNANLNGVKQFAQVVSNVPADGNAFAFEDLTLNGCSDKDYNDIVFQMKGAIGNSPFLASIVDAGKDWLHSPVGQQVEQFTVDPLDPAGNTIDAARRVNISTTGKSYQGWVGRLDPADYYSFSLGVSHDFSVRLDGLSADANIQLLDLNGTILQSSINSGTTTELINGTLNAGAYRIRVTTADNIGTPYNLQLTALPLIAGMTTTGSDAPVYLATQPSIPLVGLDVFRSADPALGSNSRFAGIDGRGFATAIIDTGITLNHPFFGGDSNSNGVADRIVYHFDYADHKDNAIDVDGHGTHVASIAASSDATFPGMAPGANIVALKVFEDGGGSSFGAVERALQWVVANARTFNIASVNLSLGDSLNHATEQKLYGIDDELALLEQNGVIVVAASGNSFAVPAAPFNSSQGVAYPAAAPNVISVGAVFDANVGNHSADGDGNGTLEAVAHTTAADRITPFSQRHVTLTDIFAPGAAIMGAGLGIDPLDLNGNDNLFGTRDDFRRNLSGTSMAAPHVAGIALLAQQLAQRVLNRPLTPSEFRNLLISTGTTINDGDDENDNVAKTGLDFRRVNMLALANAITPHEPPSNTQVITLPAPASQRIEPPRTRGDDEFDGHGPRFRIETRLGANRSTLWTSINSFFEETRSDWTTFGGSTDNRVIFNVEDQYPGWEIASVDTPTFDLLEGVDQDHEVNDYPGTTPLVEHYAVQGDTFQSLWGGSDRPWVNVFFNPIQVTLRRIA